MNNSAGSFKMAASSTEVRAGAKEDLDKISMGSAKLPKKKATPTRSLKPIAQTASMTAHTSDVIISDSLKHKPRVMSNDQGFCMDMGLGTGKSINHQKKQRKELLKNIEQDVMQFMNDANEHKEIANAFDDSASAASSISGLNKDTKIMSDINSAFSSGAHKTKAELLLW